jgi:hypothetical protein
MLIQCVDSSSFWQTTVVQLARHRLFHGAADPHPPWHYHDNPGPFLWARDVVGVWIVGMFMRSCRCWHHQETPACLWQARSRGKTKDAGRQEAQRGVGKLVGVLQLGVRLQSKETMSASSPATSNAPAFL